MAVVLVCSLFLFHKNIAKGFLVLLRLSSLAEKKIGEGRRRGGKLIVSNQHHNLLKKKALSYRIDWIVLAHFQI